MSWFQSIPVALVEAHRVMLPRLRAREALHQVNIGAVAAGTFDERSRKRVLRHWEREVSAGEARPRRAMKASPAVLEAMGIRVVIEPPSPAVG